MDFTKLLYKISLPDFFSFLKGNTDRLQHLILIEVS